MSRQKWFFFPVLFVSVVSLMTFSACATVGNQFSFKGVQSIIIGKTTRNEILSTYGQPFRVGYDNGNEKWTYGYYKYRVFGDSNTKDLDITFDKSGLVQKYTYSSSTDEDKRDIGHFDKKDNPS